MDVTYDCCDVSGERCVMPRCHPIVKHCSEHFSLESVDDVVVQHGYSWSDVGRHVLSGRFAGQPTVNSHTAMHGIHDWDR